MAGYAIGDKILGEWEIVRLLGEGGSGRVYELRRQENGRSYSAALKVISIPNRSGQTEQLRAGGLSEREIAAHYKSQADAITEECALMAELKGTSHVVSYEDHKVVPHSDGLGWDILIRMELLTPLADYRAEHPMSEREVLRMGVHLCQALELCEKHGILHRDIKPENVFVSPNGDFKLGDFGIASSRTGAQGASAAGTVNYAAPEVCAGRPADASADIYSLGLVLYQMMNGDRLPFCSLPPEQCGLEEQEQAQQRRLSGEELPAPSEAGRLFASAIAEATAFRPQDRAGGAAQLRAALMRALNSTMSIYGSSASDDAQQPPQTPAEEEQVQEPVQIYPPRKEQPPRPAPAPVMPEKKSGGGKTALIVGVCVLAAAAVIALVVMLTGGGGGDARARREAMDLGLKYLQQERYQEAADAFTQAIDLDPGRADGYVSRGEAYYDLGTSQMYEAADGMIVMPEQAAQSLVSAARDYETAGQIEPQSLTGDTPGLSFGLAAQVYADAADPENAGHFNDLAKNYAEQSDTLSEQAQDALEQRVGELEERIRELESQQSAQPQPAETPAEQQPQPAEAPAEAPAKQQPQPAEVPAELTIPAADENLEMLRNYWQSNIGMDLTAVLADVTHDGKQDLIYADDLTNAPVVEISVLTAHSGAVEKVSICRSDTLHSASTDVFLALDDASGMANIVLYYNYIGLGMFAYSFNEFYLSSLGDGSYYWESVGGLPGGTLELDADGNVPDADFEPFRQQATEYLLDKMCIYTESWSRTDMWVAPNAATALGLQQ